MKKSLKKALALLCALSLTAALCAFPTFASGVEYDDAAGKFVFETTSTSNPTDLFENFKNAMPGDTLTQEILVKNKTDNHTTAKIYLRSLGAQSGSEELLSQLTLTVAQKGSSPFFEASADQTASLTEWLELGTMAPGGSITLTLTLSVPITLGNDFQDAVGALEWQFKAEEQEVPPSPQSGVTDTILPWIVLLTGAAAVTFLAFFFGKKQKEA